jgi:hypothetical protein
MIFVPSAVSLCRKRVLYLDSHVTVLQARANSSDQAAMTPVTFLTVLGGATGPITSACP